MIFPVNCNLSKIHFDLLFCGKELKVETVQKYIDRKDKHFNFTVYTFQPFRHENSKLIGFLVKLIL